jgi:hypothetical protein
MSLVGVSAGVLSVPLVLLAQADNLAEHTFWIGPVLFTIVGVPVVGAVNGALYAVLGYPLYRWITRRADVHTYSGQFEVLKTADGKEV